MIDDVISIGAPLMLNVFAVVHAYVCVCIAVCIYLCIFCHTIGNGDQVINGSRLQQYCACKVAMFIVSNIPYIPPIFNKSIHTHKCACAAVNAFDIGGVLIEITSSIVGNFGDLVS